MKEEVGIEGRVRDVRDLEEDGLMKSTIMDTCTVQWTLTYNKSQLHERRNLKGSH